MSCDTDANAFGYVEIKDDKVISYTGDPKNPTIHKFCNDEIVHAVKLKELIEKRFVGESKVYNDNESTFYMREHAMTIATTLQGLLEESKK